jgi:hypothetical protein
LCSTCHIGKYNATTNPKHSTAGFPTTCQTCHKATDTAWTQGVFNHTTSTSFPLVGLHATAPCAACHVGGVYKGTSTLCSTCHIGKYNATTNPKHSTAGFPTTCQTCHKATDTAWTQGVFNHTTSTTFPLVGLHATAPCAACHAGGVYKGTPRDCYSCHKALYAATKNPSHTAAGFPTTCGNCHKATDTSFTQGTFAHTQFPITHGNSGGVCAACHTNSANFTVFSCTICHDRATTDSKHQGRAGYRYDSVTCYSCHPRGKAD